MLWVAWDRGRALLIIGVSTVVALRNVRDVGELVQQREGRRYVDPLDAVSGFFTWWPW
jgi:hypothetical protein